MAQGERSRFAHSSPGIESWPAKYKPKMIFSMRNGEAKQILDSPTQKLDKILRYLRFILKICEDERFSKVWKTFPYRIVDWEIRKFVTHDSRAKNVDARWKFKSCVPNPTVGRGKWPSWNRIKTKKRQSCFKLYGCPARGKESENNSLHLDFDRFENSGADNQK